MESILLAWFDHTSSSGLFLIFPSLAFVIGVFLLLAGESKGTRIPAMLFFGYIVVHITAMVGRSHVHEWIADNGQVGQLVIASIQATGNLINEEPEQEWVGNVKLANGELIDWSAPTHSLRTWPSSDHFFPKTNQVYPVRYRAARPSLVVVPLPNAAEIDRCAKLGPKVRDLQARIMLLEGEAKVAATAERDALIAQITDCSKNL